MTRDTFTECYVQYAPTEAAFIADLSVREVQKAFDEGWFDLEHRGTRTRTRRSLGLAELLHLRVIKDTCRHLILQSETKKQVHRQLRARFSNLYILSADANRTTWPSESAGSEEAYIFKSDFVCKFSKLGHVATNVPYHLLSPIIYSKDKTRTTFLACTSDKKLTDYWAENSAWEAHFRFSQKEADPYFFLFQAMVHLLKEPVRISEISIDTSVAWEEMTDRLAEITAARLSVVSDPEIRGGEPVVRGTRIPVHLLWSLAEQGASNEELLSDYPALDEERLRLALRYAQYHPRPGRPKKRPWQNAGRDE